MRFLTEAKFDLDEAAIRVLESEIESFLRVGEFTLTEWQSLSQKEKDIAVQIKKALKLEDALLTRGALQASTMEDAASLLRSSGDESAASHLFLQEAVNSLSHSMGKSEFAGVSR